MTSRPRPGTESATRVILGRFMRDRRAAISRDGTDLRPLATGRASTLTQADLAQLTGYSLRSISALEQGVDHRPTRKLLEAVATALQLNSDDRRTLWFLAADTPPPERSSSTSDLDQGMAQMVQALYPHPAFVVGDLWNIQSFNAGVAQWFSDFGVIPPDQRNMLKWLFVAEHARHVLVDWEGTTIPRALGVLRATQARRPASREVAALIEEVCDRCPEAKQQWDHHVDIYIHPPSQVRLLRAPGYTDPDQLDDTSHHVVTNMTVLASQSHGDHRRLMAFLLPDAHFNPAAVGSEVRCSACAQRRRRRAPE